MLSNTRRVDPAVLLAAGVVAALFVFIPVALPAVTTFDPPKRALWGVVLIALAAAAVRSRCMGGFSIPLLVLCIWMVLRTAAGTGLALAPLPLCTWLLPPLLAASAPAMDEDRLRRLLVIPLLTLGAGEAVLAGMQRVGWDPLFDLATKAIAQPSARMIGTIGYHNQAVDVVALCALLLFLAGPPSRVRDCGWLLAGVWISLTGNRGGLLAFVLAWGCGRLVEATVAVGGRRSFRAVLVPGLAIVAALCFTPAGIRLRQTLSHPGGDGAVGTRIEMLRVAFAMVKEHPLLGSGAGAFANEYLDRISVAGPLDLDHAALARRTHARETHNDPIQFAAEFGLLGLALAGGAILMAARAVRRTEQPSRFAAFMALLTYMSVSSLFSFTWQSAAAGPLAGLLLGVLATSRQTAQTTGRSVWPSWSFLALSSGVAAWLALDSVRNVVVAVRLGGGNPEAAARFSRPGGHAYLALAGAALAAKGDWEKAANVLEEASAGYRDHVLYANLGRCGAARNDWSKAEEWFSRWAATGLDHRGALADLSVAQERNRNWRAAARTTARLAALWPQQDMAFYERLATLKFMAEDYEGCFKTADGLLRETKARGANPSAKVENLAGAACAKLGRRDDAIWHFSAALYLDPGLESARRNLEQLVPPAGRP